MNPEQNALSLRTILKEKDVSCRYSSICKISSDFLIGKTHQRKERYSIKRCKYQRIDKETRLKLIDLVLNGGFSVKKAAEKLKLKFSTSKAVVKLYKEEGRLFKNDNQNRKRGKEMKLQCHETKFSEIS
jgi:transposase-like protein